MPHWTDTDREYMRLALALAAKGEGFVEPNPMVGCVMVWRGRIVGQGYHRRFGGLHAEPNALRRAGVDARGATAYVTLEPCSHFGKTPPCTDALIRAGLKRVVVAMRDPNPLVSGRGLRALRKAGIQIDVGLLRAEAMALSAPFVKYHKEKRPYVILKWAQSIDGKIATRVGDSKWITSRQSRAAGHALRARVDGVIVGIGTVLADDPVLTARMAKPRRIATRIVLDGQLRTPMDAKLVRSARKAPTLIVTASRPSDGREIDRKRRRLERAGCEVVPIEATRKGLNLGRLLEALYRRQMTNILVEGGGKLIGSFVDAGLADEARVFVAPILIGGEDAPGPLRGVGPSRMQDAVGAKVTDVTPYGPDLCYTVVFRRRG